MIWGIIYVGIFVFWFVQSIRTIIAMLGGYFELKKIREMSFAGIRLGTISQSKQKRILLLVLAVLLIVLSGGVSYLVITRFFNIYYLLAFVLMFVTSWIDLLKAILLYRYSEDCYLTEAGIITIDGIFKKDKCRFILAEEIVEGKNGTKYINVYKEKNENPYRFEIKEREHEVVEIINGFRPIIRCGDIG